MRLPPTHRIAQLYYIPRVLAYALGFASTLILFFEGVVSWITLSYVGVVCLVYPHLARVRVAYSKDGKRAELQNLLLDGFVAGTWAAAIGFNLGLSFAMLCAVCLNNTLNGGLRRGGRAVGCFILGSLVASLVTGFRFDPLSSPTTTFLGLLSIFIYALTVALVFHGQNRHLLRAKDNVDQKRRLFKGLVSAGLVAGSSSKLADMLADVLPQLRVMLGPDSRYVFVLRDARRARGFFHVLASPPEDEALQKLADEISSYPPGQLQDASTKLAGHEQMQCFSLLVEPAFIEGLLVVRGNVADSENAKAVDLFLQQLGATIENRSLIRRLRHLAMTDPLTGLANRASFDSELRRLSEAETDVGGGAGFSLLAIDVNGLKPINDQYGHNAGDALLKVAAEVLCRACRESDIVARTGGDEFVVLCPGTTVAHTRTLVERIRDSARKAEVSASTEDGSPVRLALSMSIGAANTQECTPAEIMHLADTRMYADKSAHYGRTPV